jgi:uncharacterized protein (DUF697 family)
MSTDAGEPGRGFSPFERLTTWAVPRLRALLGHEAIHAHRDTLERLLGGDFRDLQPEERARRVEEIIQVSASTAVGMASLPLPFLDLPILVGMVGAIGKVNGLDIADKQLYTQVLATLGGGLMARQLLRTVPFGGTVYAAQIYGATYALGRVAQTYCTEKKLPDAAELQRLFEETLAKKAAEHQARQEAALQAAGAKPQGGGEAAGADAGGENAGATSAVGTGAGGTGAGGTGAGGTAAGTAKQRLLELQGLKEHGLVTEQEYQRKREQILAGL